MNQTNDNWQPCQPGQLKDLARGLQTKQQHQAARRTLLGATGAVAAVVLLLAIGGMFFSGAGDGPPVDYGFKGGLSCREVVDMYDSFANGDLDGELTARVTRHLDDCPHCRQKLGAEPRDRASRRDLEAATLISGHFAP